MLTARIIYKGMLVSTLTGMVLFTFLENHNRTGWSSVIGFAGASVYLWFGLKRLGNPNSYKFSPADSDEEILCKALGKLGGSEASAAASKLPNNMLETTINVPGSIEALERSLGRYFADNGELIKSEMVSGTHEVKGVIGSGHMNLNPAVVTVRLEKFNGEIHVGITGSAKEGLVKQFAGEAAANRIKDFLLSKESTEE